MIRGELSSCATAKEILAIENIAKNLLFMIWMLKINNR